MPAAFHLCTVACAVVVGESERRRECAWPCPGDLLQLAARSFKRAGWQSHQNGESRRKLKLHSAATATLYSRLVAVRLGFNRGPPVFADRRRRRGRRRRGGLGEQGEQRGHRALSWRFTPVSGLLFQTSRLARHAKNGNPRTVGSARRWAPKTPKA